MEIEEPEARIINCIPTVVNEPMYVGGGCCIDVCSNEKLFVLFAIDEIIV